MPLQSLSIQARQVNAARSLFTPRGRPAPTIVLSPRIVCDERADRDLESAPLDPKNVEAKHRASQTYLCRRAVSKGRMAKALNGTGSDASRPVREARAMGHGPWAMAKAMAHRHGHRDMAPMPGYPGVKLATWARNNLQPCSPRGVECRHYDEIFSLQQASSQSTEFAALHRRRAQPSQTTLQPAM